MICRVFTDDFFVVVDTIHHREKERSHALRTTMVGEQIAAASPL